MSALPRRHVGYVPKLKSERPVHYPLYVFARHTKSVLTGIEKRTHALVSFRQYLCKLSPLLLPPLDDGDGGGLDGLGKGRQKRAHFAGTTNRAHFAGTYCIMQSQQLHSFSFFMVQLRQKIDTKKYLMRNCCRPNDHERDGEP